MMPAMSIPTASTSPAPPGRTNGTSTATATSTSIGGHGALILGHGHPRVTAAVREAVGEGTQFGANHPREIAWARAIQRLVPSAERLRFTSSGTEATLMAVRLARAFTGRDTLLRFHGHFHGWHDHMTHGFTSHFDGTPDAGRAGRRRRQGDPRAARRPRRGRRHPADQHRHRRRHPGADRLARSARCRCGPNSCTGCAS